MSIASAIINARQRIADTYTAINNKGGTLPSVQNSSNLGNSINSIPSGISSVTVTKVGSTGTAGVYTSSSAGSIVCAANYNKDFSLTKGETYYVMGERKLGSNYSWSKQFTIIVS